MDFRWSFVEIWLKNKGWTWNRRKRSNLVKFSIFWKQKFANLLWLVLDMPKPDKNDAFIGLILGHEVLQKCSNFFLQTLGLILNPKFGWKKVQSLQITRRVQGEPEASDQQP